MGTIATKGTNVFRVRFTIAGGHVHCRLFCAPGGWAISQSLPRFINITISEARR